MTTIDPLVLHFFNEKVASATAALTGAGILGAGVLGAKALGTLNEDRAYGRAERLQELARKKKAQIRARNMSRYSEEKQASATAGLVGAGALGAGLLGYGALSNINQDRAYGRAERLEELARKKKAKIKAKNMSRYSSGGESGGMY